MDVNVEQIIVRGQKVGIIGLSEALFEVSKETLDDENIKERLYQLLSKKNYIPDKVCNDYKEAFLREYKKRILKESVDETDMTLEIKVLGPGCANCERLFKNVQQAVLQLGIVADIEYIKDIKQIGTYGVMGTPALIINKKVKSVGKVPSVKEIIDWLK